MTSRFLLLLPGRLEQRDLQRDLQHEAELSDARRELFKLRAVHELTEQQLKTTRDEVDTLHSKNTQLTREVDELKHLQLHEMAVEEDYKDAKQNLMRVEDELTRLELQHRSLLVSHACRHRQTALAAPKTNNITTNTIPLCTLSVTDVNLLVYFFFDRIILNITAMHNFTTASFALLTTG